MLASPQPRFQAVLPPQIDHLPLHWNPQTQTQFQPFYAVLAFCGCHSPYVQQTMFVRRQSYQGAIAWSKGLPGKLQQQQMRDKLHKQTINSCCPSCLLVALAPIILLLCSRQVCTKCTCNTCCLTCLLSSLLRLPLDPLALRSLEPGSSLDAWRCPLALPSFFGASRGDGGLGIISVSFTSKPSGRWLPSALRSAQPQQWGDKSMLLQSMQCYTAWAQTMGPARYSQHSLVLLGHDSCQVYLKALWQVAAIQFALCTQPQQAA